MCLKNSHYVTQGSHSNISSSAYYFGIVVLLFITGSMGRPLQAQLFPAFANPGTVSSATPLTGVSLVEFYSNAYPDLLLNFYTDGPTGVLAFAYATPNSPSSFSGSNLATNSSGANFFVDQNAVTGQSTSGVSTMVYLGNLYVGYVEANTHQFVVLEASVGTGAGVQYTFTEVYRDTNPGAVNTAAGAAVLNGNSNLVFIYGTARNPSIKNEAWTTWLDSSGVWHSEDANFNTPTQPGITYFPTEGINFVVTKQNNSNNGIWIQYVDNTGHYVPGSGHQINGGSVYWRTPFGFSMTVWNNELIFAADGQGGGSPLCIYASYDGVNWAAQSYPGLYIGNNPAISLFSGSLSAAGQVNGSHWTMLGTQN